MKLNTEVMNTILDDVIEDLGKAGTRLSNVKNPKKDAGEAFADARTSKKNAEDLMTGELKDKFQALVKTANPGKTPYTSMKGVGSGDMRSRIEALGGAMAKRKNQADYLQTWNKPMTREERGFVEAFEKYQSLNTQSQESNRLKTVMKKDSDIKDGSGYAPMDGEGFIGGLLDKVKGFMSNTHEVKNEASVSNATQKPREVRIQAVPSKKPADMNAGGEFKMPKPPTPAAPNKPVSEGGVLQGEWKGTNYDPFDRYQNRVDATSANIGEGAVSGVEIGPGMAAVSRIPNSDQSEIRLGTVIQDPNTGEIYLIADLMNRRFDGQKKIDFATPNTGTEINPKYNQTFSGFKVLRQGAGYEDAREFVNSGEWEALRNQYTN